MKKEPIFKRLDPADIEICRIDEKSRTIWHTISREIKDRMGDIVRIGGGDFSNFMRKPGVLYGHDYRSMNPVPVIAEGVGFKIEGDKLIAETRFLNTDDPKMSQPLKDLVNDNWLLHKQKLLGWSIGFMPLEWDEMKDQGRYVGTDFKTWELLEYSSVIIPAHQDAVNDAISKGLVSETFLSTLPEELRPAAVGIIGKIDPEETRVGYSKPLVIGEAVKLELIDETKTDKRAEEIILSPDDIKRFSMILDKMIKDKTNRIKRLKEVFK